MRSDELLALGLWIGMWAIYLPTGVLAWREPDTLEPGSDNHTLPAASRDACSASHWPRASRSA